LRARDFRGDVNLENSDRLDDIEGGCESDGVAFAHMSESCDAFDAKSSSGSAKDSDLLDGGHVQSRTVRTCNVQGATGRTRFSSVLQVPSTNLIQCCCLYTNDTKNSGQDEIGIRVAGVGGGRRGAAKVEWR
jgi:hypothetical protein